MNLGERVKQIRKDISLSQDAFGDSLGVSRDVIKNLENNRIKNISDALLRLICRTYNVSYQWLTEEIGEPYVQVPSVIVDAAVEKYHLDELDKKIIEEYMKLSPESRNVFKNYIASVFQEAESSSGPIDWSDVPDTPEELERRYPPVDIHGKKEIG